MEKVKGLFNNIAFVYTSIVAAFGAVGTLTAFYINNEIAAAKMADGFSKLKGEYSQVTEKTTELLERQNKTHLNMIRLQSRLKYLERLAKVNRSELENVQYGLSKRGNE